VTQHLLNLLLPEAPLQILLLHPGKHVIQEALLNSQLICARLQKHKRRWLLNATYVCLHQWSVGETVWAMHNYCTSRYAMWAVVPTCRRHAVLAETIQQHAVQKI